ncbi:MAG: VWA domain-containing protein [Pirellulales bacterium]
MSKSRDNVFDRLLRYSPWAAAALVGLCFVALVGRVVMYAGSGDRGEMLASAAETEQLSERGRSEKPTDLEVGRTSISATLEGRRTQAGAASGIQGSLKQPQTPSSKSRLEIHGVGDSLVARETERKAGGRTTREAGSASSDSPTASTLDAISRLGRHAPSLDGRVHTSFFGLEASGRRFVYVLDRSGSMGDPDNKPLAAAKEELLSSLARLGSVQQFFLIFYNEEPAIFNAIGGGRQLVFADEQNQRSARRFVQSIQARGGTRHYEALAKAIALRPDVIFLLTDGEPKDDLTAEELARLKRSNGGLSQIQVVQFADSPYDRNSLVQLANENRGQHTYKNIREIVSRSPVQR